MQSLDNLKKLGKLDQAGNEAWKHFQKFNQAAMEEGAIPSKYKELIALAVALTTQCSYCLHLHNKGAVKAGATQEEIAEVAMVAAALRAGGALTHSTEVLE